MKKLLLLTLLFTGLNFYGQYEAAHWFFGDHCGLDFTSGSPVREPGSMISTEEGCSSISTVCGDLVLYTDGITVWNANHQVMQNGNGLMGDPSSTQSGIIVPNPDLDNIYYIFTVDDGFSSPSSDGMRYSVVDMNLAGGLGGVISGQKNIPLVNRAGEKVTAVVSSDNSSIWVVTFAPHTNSTTAPYNTIGNNFNTFFAFRVTGTGVIHTAVVSTVNINVDGGVGYMKVSPDGTKLAIANMYDNSAYLLDFDDTTGEISNPVALPLLSSANKPYGVEFSPDSSKLYLGDLNNKVYQFDLSNNNARTIIDSHQNYRSAFQLGLDGKIYQTHTIGYGYGTNTMSVIENPNEAGTACNYRYRLINLGGGMQCHQGLPPFIQSYFVQIVGLSVAANINADLEVTSNEAMLSVDWDFGDGNTANTLPDNPPDNTHSQTQHAYVNPGIYTVTATIHLAVGCDVVVTTDLEIYPYPITSPLNDTVVCDVNQNMQTSVNLHDYDTDINNLQNYPGTYEIHYYETQTDAENGTNELSDPYISTGPDQEIFFTVLNQTTNVQSIGSFHIIINPLPVIQNLTAFEVCDNDTDGIYEFDFSSKSNDILAVQTAGTNFDIHFYPTQTDAETGTNEITNTATYTNVNPFNETIWYSITNTDTGCVNYGSFDIIVHPLFEINMVDEYDICTGQTVQLDAPAGYVNYDWSTGETTQSIVVNSAGTYTITLTDSNGCTNSKTITVNESDVAIIDNVEVVDFTDNNSITIYAHGIGDYEYSLDGMNYQDSNTFYGLEPGTYTVYVSDKNACGVVQQTVDLLGAPRFFTPNGDGYNDFWQVINVHKKPETYVYIYDRYGRLLKKLASSEPGWDGTYNGQPVPSTDYWYIVYVKDNNEERQVKGHFALKR